MGNMRCTCARASKKGEADKIRSENKEKMEELNTGTDTRRCSYAQRMGSKGERWTRDKSLGGQRKGKIETEQVCVF